MSNTIHNLRKQGFTLIELLIVVAIIGILAVIAIPGYIGMQEKAKKGQAIRSATASEPELQAWLHSAIKGLAAGEGIQGQLFEVDSDGDGLIQSGVDYNNSSLGALLSNANSLCSQYVNAKQASQKEMSPWVATSGSLWAFGVADAGRITCGHGAGVASVTITVKDSAGQTIHTKTIYTD